MSGPSVKVPADWLDSDRVEEMGADGAMLMLSALGYSARQTSEGVVPRRALRKLWPVDDLEDAISRIADAGEVDDQGEQLVFVNWRDFILPSDEVERIKEQNRVRDERRRRHGKGDHTMCSARYCTHVTISRESHVSARVTHDDPIRPDPTPREEKGGGAAERPARRRSGREESTIPKDPNAPRCQHGTVSGMRIVGRGADASRLCGQCEVLLPAGEATGGSESAADEPLLEETAVRRAV